MPGLPHRAARKRGVASSSERCVSTCAPSSMSMRATATLPLSAAACSGVVFLACVDTKALGLPCPSRACSTVATQSSSPTLHAPTTTAAVISAPAPARCFTALSGPAASRSASIAAASSLNALSSSSSSSVDRSPASSVLVRVSALGSVVFAESSDPGEVFEILEGFLEPGAPSAGFGDSSRSSAKSTTMSAAYLAAASMGVVHPLGAHAFTSAPCFTSRSTTSSAPPSAAMCIGVESTTNAP